MTLQLVISFTAGVITGVIIVLLGIVVFGGSGLRKSTEDSKRG